MNEAVTLQKPIDPDLLAHALHVAKLQEQYVGSGLSAADRRRWISDLGALSLPGERPDGIESKDLYIAAAGREIPVRLYGNKACLEGKSSAGKLMVYFHGGGWVTGSLATHDLLCAHIALFTGYMVASVHYRRAPENPFPAAHDDCLLATHWLVQNSALFGVEYDTAFALAGDSSGAHLALGTAMRLLEENNSRCDRMLLFYPPVEPDAETESMGTYRDGPGLTAQAMQDYWRTFAGDVGLANRHPLLHSLGWPRMEELPSCVIMTAEHDVLRDEGEILAEHLRSRHVVIRHTRALGMIHGFARMLTVSKQAQAYVRQACCDLISLA